MLLAGEGHQVRLPPLLTPLVARCRGECFELLSQHRPVRFDQCRLAEGSDGAIEPTRRDVYLDDQRPKACSGPDPHSVIWLLVWRDVSHQ